MRQIFTKFNFFGLVFLLHSAVIYAQIKVTDLTKIKQIGNISFAPDGKKAVYTLTSIEPDAENKEEYKYISQLYLTDFQNNMIALTQGAESSRQAVWSPDGKSIAFVRTVKGKSQIFILPINGGEAYQLTQSKYNVSNPAFSPDGKKILFSLSFSFTELLKDSLFNPSKQAPTWNLEKPGFEKNEQVKIKNPVKPNPDGNLEEIRAYLEKDVEDKKAKVINRLNFQGESTTEPEMNFTHLAMLDLSEKAVLKPFTQGFYSFGQAIWLPNNQGIIYVGNNKTDNNPHPDRIQESNLYWQSEKDLYVIAIGFGFKKRYFNPVIAEDGKTLVFQSTDSEGLNLSKICFTNLNPAKNGFSEVDFDLNANNLTISADAKYLYFTAQSHGGQPLYRFLLKAGNTNLETLSDFNTGITDFDLTKDKILFAKIEVANPAELYSADLNLKNAQRLSDFNYKWLKDRKLSFPEKHTFVNEKGQTVEYWIMKPTAVESGKKYPLLLQMHGGPTAMWGPGEQSMWHELQFFCSKGYGIVYANPRGSGGYGNDFLKANFQDWGTGPSFDVLRACTEAAKEAWVDSSQQVITGGSYAGYLTAWILAHDYRFKAAFSQRGVYDLTTFMGEGNAWRLVPNYFGGYPWQADIKKVLDENSPYTFVDKIKTPLLIKHGENDLRTGVIQSEMMYKSLKILGREVEYVRVPGATHELSRSGNVRQRIDRLLRIYEFMERYIGKTEIRN